MNNMEVRMAVLEERVNSMETNHQRILTLLERQAERMSTMEKKIYTFGGGLAVFIAALELIVKLAK